MKISNTNVLIGFNQSINLLANSINDNDVSMEYLKDTINYLSSFVYKSTDYGNDLWRYNILLESTLYHCRELRKSLKTGDYLESSLMNVVDRLNRVFSMRLRLNKV